MKILIISHSSNLYGASRSLLNVIEGLKIFHPEVRVHVFLKKGGQLESYLKKKEVTYTVVNYEKGIYKPTTVSGEPSISFKRCLQGVRKLRYLPSFIQEVKKVEPDVIYTNTSTINYGFFAAKILGIKHIWHIREFLWKGIGNLFDFGSNFQRFLYNRSEYIIAISEAIKVHELRGVQSPIVVIYNGIYFEDELQWMSRHIANKKNVTFSVVGVIHKSKGQEEAIKAFARFVKVKPGAQLFLAGSALDKSYEGFLKSLCEKLGVADKVRFLGFLKDVEPLYEQTDVLLNCSQCEGLGRTIIEAMARGIPVICRNSGGSVELIKEGVNGYLYNTIPELVDQMNQVIDTIKYAELSKAAIPMVKENYTIEKCTQQIVEVLNNLEMINRDRS